MLKINNYLELLRVKQWYKNTIIFISIIFSFNLFNLELLALTFLGFISLCFVSSSYYIINDILDVKKDKNHPEKKHRPIASGKIKKSHAITVSIFLFIASVFLSYFLSFYFLLMILLLFVLSQIYSFYLRDIIFLDIILISLNFVIRAISGVFIIKASISPWVVLCTFFISLFLVSEKRSVEISLNKSKNYRPHFEKSDKRILEFLAILSITCVFVFFSIYSILFDRIMLLWSIPIALYIVLLFLHDSYKYPEKVRNPEDFVFDKKVLFSILLWLLVVLITLYYFI